MTDDNIEVNVSPPKDPVDNGETPLINPENLRDEHTTNHQLGVTKQTTNKFRACLRVVQSWF